MSQARTQRDLALEGLLVEPASAAAPAGVRTIARRGELPKGVRVVLVSTSGGLKNLERGWLRPRCRLLRCGSSRNGPESRLLADEALLGSHPEPAAVEPTLSAVLAALEDLSRVDARSPRAG